MRIAINTLALYNIKVGMGRYIVELVNRVPKNDLENHYILYISQENEKYFDVYASNVTIKEVPRIFTFPFLKIIWEQLVLPFSLVKNKVNVYHATGFVLPLWKPKRIKYIVTIADMTFFTHAQYHIWFKNCYFRALIPTSLKRADKIIAISENTKADIVALTKTNPEKIVTTHLAADPYFVPESKEKCAIVLAKYNLQQPYILFVGMLEPRKNIFGIIEAFSMLKDKKNHILVIVGKKGWMYEEIFELVKREKLTNEVIFTGYVPDQDLPALYTAATCFLYPSFYEGFGIPIIEAMACGCPVITSNTSSLKEIAGNAAILVEPSDTSAIKKAIGEIVTNAKKRNELSIKGKRQAKKFSWQKMAEDTKELYNVVLQMK